MADGQQQVGMSASDIARLTSQQQASSGGGGGEDNVPTFIDSFLRLFGVNGHSTSGGLDTVLNLGGIWGGFSLQNTGIFKLFDKNGGPFAGFLSQLSASIESITGSAPSATPNPPANMGGGGGGAAGGGGGDAQYASLQTMPSSASVDISAAAQNIQIQGNIDTTPSPRGSSAPKRASKGEGSSAGFGI